MSIRLFYGLIFLPLVFVMSMDHAAAKTISSATETQSIPNDAQSLSGEVASATLSSSTAFAQHNNPAFAALKKQFQTQSEDGTPPKPTEVMSQAGGQSTLQALGQMLISLAFVILLVLGLAWLAKKYVIKNRTLGGGYIEVLGTYTLSAKAQIHLVRIGNNHMLLGEGGQSVTLISHVEPFAQEEPPFYEELPDESNVEEMDDPQDMTSFHDRLNHWQDALQDKKMKQEVNASMVFLSKLSQRLKEKGEKRA